MGTTIIKSANSDNQAIVNSNGELLVSSSGGGGSNASVGPTGSTPPASGTQIAGVDTDGNLRAVSVDDNGFVNVNGTSVVTGTVNTKQDGLNSFKTSQYSVGTSEIQVTPTPLTSRSSISLKVITTGQDPVFFCQSPGSVMTEGYPLYSGDSVQMDLTPSGTIYAVSASPGQMLYVLEIA